MADPNLILHLLSSDIRRELLLALCEQDRINPFTDERWDQDTTLHHVHVPKLAAHDIIEWNRETGVITVGAQFDTAVAVLAVFEEQNDVSMATDLD